MGRSVLDLSFCRILLEILSIDDYNRKKVCQFYAVSTT